MASRPAPVATLLGLTERGALTRPVYKHVLRALERGIALGTLAPGARLPAERELAGQLRVSRATVVRAYRELESRGLVRGYVGRGTFVSGPPDASGAPFAWRGKLAASATRETDTMFAQIVQNSTNPRLLAAAAGAPALDAFPLASFRTSLERTLQRQTRLLWGHGPTEGQAELRSAIARRFGGEPENVLVLAGAQQGLDLLARCLIDPGDTVVIDRPGYPGAIHTFRAAGARMVGWDIVRQDPDELEDLFVRYRPKLLYTNPSFQNPTGTQLSIHVRRAVLRLAARFRVPLIEDDTYRELSFAKAPPASLHSLDEHSIVIFLSSFSKVIAPALRLGWICAAEPIVEQLARIKSRADPLTPTLMQFAIADFVDGGAFDAHLGLLRQEHRRRCAALTAALDSCGAQQLLRWNSPDGGLYLWCTLNRRVRASAVLPLAVDASVAFVPGEAFFAGHGGDAHLRLCFSGVLPKDAGEVARRLVRAVAAAHGTARPSELRERLGTA